MMVPTRARKVASMGVDNIVEVARWTSVSFLGIKNAVKPEETQVEIGGRARGRPYLYLGKSQLMQYSSKESNGHSQARRLISCSLFSTLQWILSLPFGLQLTCLGLLCTQDPNTPVCFRPHTSHLVIYLQNATIFK